MARRRAKTVGQGLFKDVSCGLVARNTEPLPALPEALTADAEFAR